MLDKLPKRLQPEAKEKLRQIWMAATKADADPAFDLFLASYQAKYPKATECLAQDRDVLLKGMSQWSMVRAARWRLRPSPAAPVAISTRAGPCGSLAR